MDRSEVYKVIDSERDYQDIKWKEYNDANNNVADWLNYMEKHIQNAKDALYEMEEDEALEYVRKATALGVACMEYYGVKSR